MNRSGLVSALQHQSGLSAREADWLVRSFFEVLAEGLVTDQRIELRGFGVFKLNLRRQAGFHNPKDQRYYGALPIKTIKFYGSFSPESPS